MNIHSLKFQLDLETNFYEFSEREQLIYFLTKNEEIVYIGISDTKNVFGRIKSHKQDKDFNAAKYTVLNDLTRYQSERIESGLISLIRPVYNKRDSYVQISVIQDALDYFNGGELPIVKQKPLTGISLLFCCLIYLVIFILAGSVIMSSYALVLTFGYNGFFDLFTFFVFLVIAGCSVVIYKMVNTLDQGNLTPPVVMLGLLETLEYLLEQTTTNQTT